MFDLLMIVVIDLVAHFVFSATPGQALVLGLLIVVVINLLDN